MWNAILPTLALIHLMSNDQKHINIRLQFQIFVVIPFINVHIYYAKGHVSARTIETAETWNNFSLTQYSSTLKNLSFNEKKKK